MSIVDAMIHEFTQESANTRKALARVPEDKFGWKPHEKSMTLGELASHLADAPEWVDQIVNSEEFTIDLDQFKPFLASSKEELLAVFDKNTAAAVNLLQGLTDEKILQIWRLKLGPVTLFEMPRTQVLRGMIFNHSIHHRGQLTVYLRLNDIPVPALYGPSADEQG